jgi:hypothetical protein
MATVTASFKLADGSPYVGSVLFRPRSTPLVSSPNLVVANGDVTVYTDENGALSVALIAGNYRVYAGSGRAVLITVPSGSSTYNLLDLITSTLPADSDYSWTPGTTYALATNSTPGILRTSSDSGDPEALLVTDAEATYAQLTPTDGSYRVNGSGVLQFYNPDTAKWHTLTPRGPDGAVYSEWGPGED